MVSLEEREKRKYPNRERERKRRDFEWNAGQARPLAATAGK